MNRNRARWRAHVSCVVEATATDRPDIRLGSVGMDSSLIRRLVTTHLQPLEREDVCLQRFGSAGAIASEAVARSGFGLDLYSGERVLASLAVRGRTAVAFTNHRTIVGGGGIAISVRHDEVVGIAVAAGKLELRTTLGTRDLTPLLPASDSVVAFFRALASTDPRERAEPPCPTFTPGGADPTGAQGAIRELWSNDPSAAMMLGEIARRSRSGDLDEGAAQDLVGRVVLAHRARCCGAAAFGSSFLSPLPAADFGELVLSVLGTPMRRMSMSAGVERMEFASVSVSYREVSGGTSYTLHAEGKRLEAHDAALAHDLHGRLVDGAHEWLARICIPLRNAG